MNSNTRICIQNLAALALAVMVIWIHQTPGWGVGAFVGLCILWAVGDEPKDVEDDANENASNMEMVCEFHTAFGAPVQHAPELPATEERRHLRMRLLSEEFREYCQAEGANDIVEIADALADMTYIIYGTAVEYGIPLDAVFREVHRSNMSKLDENGKPILREDGKVLKSRLWSPPDIDGILELATVAAAMEGKR
jgi:predicted HAD superfamily Cof-like phosphohydrolase